MLNNYNSVKVALCVCDELFDAIRYSLLRTDIAIVFKTVNLFSRRHQFQWILFESVLLSFAIIIVIVIFIAALSFSISKS